MPPSNPTIEPDWGFGLVCKVTPHPALTFARLRLEYGNGLGNDVRCFGPEVFERVQRFNRVHCTLFVETPANDLPAFADAK